MNPQTREFTNYNQLDNIGKLRIGHARDAYLGKNEKFWVVGENGIYSFHPDSLKPDLKPPSLVWKDISINNKPATKKERVDFFGLGMITLPYTKNDLTIEYTGIHLAQPEKNQYAYQMIGLNDDWQEVGTERTARFLDLAPGNYIFKVKAANADSIWSESIEQKITILPPWWQTWWAYLLYALAAIGTFAYWYRGLQQKIKQKEAQLQKEQAHNQELQTLNEANQRFVPQDFLAILGKTSIKDLQLGDQTETKMTILFSDIRSYTTLSETMTPQENFKFINGYLGRIGPIIKKHKGFY